MELTSGAGDITAGNEYNVCKQEDTVQDYEERELHLCGVIHTHIFLAVHVNSPILYFGYTLVVYY